jgi:ubiquinone biosynthesis protein
MVLEELGTTTIKLGQMLASRPDLFPEEYQRELAKLQDHAEPFPGAEARKIIERELKEPIDKLFADFTDDPFASASIGQAHEAVLHDGTRVIIKVQRPGIADTVEADLDLLGRLADLLEAYVPETKVVRPRMLVDEFARSIRSELDFVGEAAYTSRFHEEFLHDERIVTPRVYWDLTSSRVLTMQKMQGEKITNLERLKTLGIDNRKLAADLNSVFMQQYFELGILHADPHPGNVLVTDDGKLCLLDFGQVAHLSRDLREQLVTIFIALGRTDFDTIVDVYTELGITSPETDLRAFKRDLIEMADRYLGVPIRTLDIRRLFTDLTRTARQNNIVLPRDLVLLGKSMVTVAGISRQLDPGLNVAEKVRAHAEKLITDRMKPANIMDRASRGLWRILRLTNKLPAEIGEILRRLRTGTLEIAFRHEGLEQPVNELDKTGNRLAVSIIVAATILGSSLMMMAKLAPLIPGTDISAVGLAGFILSAILAVWLAVAILRSGRL